MDALDRYVRDIRSLPLLTPQEEQELGDEVRQADQRWRSALLANPAAALAVAARWEALRAAGRRGTRIMEWSAEGAGPRREERLVRAMGRLGTLLATRARAVEDDDSTGRERSEAAIRALLQRLDLSVRFLEEMEAELEDHPVRAARRAGMTARELRRMLQSSREAHAQLAEIKQRFVCANVKLVIHIARVYRDRGLPFADLVQEGNIGLLRAVEKFDPDRGVRFSSYAAFWIRQAIQRAIQCKARMIRVPPLVEEQVRSIRRAESLTRNRAGIERPLEERSAELRMEPCEAVGLVAALRPPVSIDAPAYEDSEPLVHTLYDPDSPQPSEIVAGRDLQRVLKALMRNLDPRERRVVQRRFGLDDRVPETLDSIGHDLRLSRERVRQIEKRALERLRALIAEQMPDGALEPDFSR